MRTIKFRVQRIDNGKWLYGYYTTARLPIFGTMGHFINKDGFHAIEILPNTVGQYTGLKDKNNNICIFEGDILSLSGILIGNKYENEGLLKDGTNLLIDGLCTKEWLSTYQEAIKRGCINAK